MARRKRHEEAHENHERWLLTYADLITLLMVFFVVMYSMSRADVSKFAKLQAALQRAFRVEVLKGNEPTSIDGSDGSNPQRSIIEHPLSNPSSALTDTRLISTIDELRTALLQIPQPAPPNGAVQLGVARDGVVISLSGNVLFDSGRAELKTAGLALLDTLAERLREMPNDVRVEGHTDDIPIETSVFPSNWELSAARAVSVARYLTQYGRIRPQRLEAAGFGEYRPEAPNTTREGRSRNRRVDIVIVFASLPVTSGPGIQDGVLAAPGLSNEPEATAPVRGSPSEPAPATTASAAREPAAGGSVLEPAGVVPGREPALSSAVQ